MLRALIIVYPENHTQYFVSIKIKHLKTNQHRSTCIEGKEKFALLGSFPLTPKPAARNQAAVPPLDTCERQQDSPARSRWPTLCERLILQQAGALSFCVQQPSRSLSLDPKILHPKNFDCKLYIQIVV
jgi:hypothetical protein